MGITESQLGYMLIPTLRIIMTSECNGTCFFCHREGNALCKSNFEEMDLEIISRDIIPAIHKIGIKKVIFTGGEPTLHSRLPEAVRMLKLACRDVQVEITTNGYNLEHLYDVQNYIDKITLSISSLSDEIFMRYTMVNPLSLIKIMQQFAPVKKSVSIVITEDNVDEIEDLVALFIKNAFEIKLQFVISQVKNDVEWERKIIYKLFSLYGRFDICMGATPVLYKELENKAKIIIKLSSLNAWMYDNIFIRKTCIICEKRNECIERGCSIRVFPDGKVTPCLNQFKCFASEDVVANLEAAYQAMQII